MKKLILGILVLFLVALVPSVMAAPECDHEGDLEVLSITFDSNLAAYEPGVSVDLGIELENTGDEDITIPINGVQLGVYDSDDSLIDTDYYLMSLNTAQVVVPANDQYTLQATWVVEPDDYEAYVFDGKHQFDLYVIADEGTSHCDVSSSYPVVLDNYPELDDIISKIATQGTQFSYTAEASDADNNEDEAPIDTLVFSLDTAPSGMTITGSTGVISWTPLNEHVGTNAIVVKVSDDVGGVDTESFNIVVGNINDAPTLTSIDDIKVQEDIAINDIELPEAVDVDSTVASESLTYVLSVVSAPDESTFAEGYIDEKVVSSTWSGWDVATRKISGWEPDRDDVGELTLRLTVTDTEGLFAEQEFSLYVYPDDMCKEGEIGSDLILTLDEPENGDDYGPGDTIYLEVTVENDAGHDKDVVVVAMLYDLTDHKKLAEVESDEENLDESGEDDDELTFKLELQVPLDSDVDYEGDYVLYVKAYEDGKEDEQCLSDMVELDISRESHEVIVRSMTVTPSTVNPGETVDVAVTVLNLGRKDEEGVVLKLRSEDLEISLTSDAKDLGAYDESGCGYVFEFEVEVPLDLKAGTYEFEAYVVFDGGAESTSYIDSPTFNVDSSMVVVEESSIVTTTGLTTAEETLEETTTEEEFPWSTVAWIVGDIVLIIVAIFFIKLIFSGRKRQPEIKEVKL